MNNLPIEIESNYKSLLLDCISIVQETLEDARWRVISGYYRIGETILNYQRDGKIEKKYGAMVMQRLEQDLRDTGSYISLSNLYRAIQLATLFTSETELVEYYNRHNGITWTYIRENVLPKATEHPERNGGIEAVANESLSTIEQLGHKLEEVHDMIQSMPEEIKEQAVNAMQKSLGVLGELSEIQYSPSAKIKTDRSEAYLDYIRGSPCFICNNPSDAHHVEKSGTGIKGSDYMTVPLCRKHHSQIDEFGVETFERQYLVDLGVKAMEYHLPYLLLLERIIAEGQER